MKNVIENKSFVFALDVVRLYKKLSEKKVFDLGRQVLRSGTSIGANVKEAQYAQSKKDFIAKMHVAQKRQTRRDIGSIF